MADGFGDERGGATTRGESTAPSADDKATHMKKKTQIGATEFAQAMADHMDAPPP